VRQPTRELYARLRLLPCIGTATGVCWPDTATGETSQSLPDRLLLVQVILMRTTDSYDTLPALLKDSNALTMTVPQNKARAAM
jgi:hypothetical protein